MADRLNLGFMRGVAQGAIATLDVPIQAYYNYFTLHIRGGFSANGNVELPDHSVPNAIQEFRVLINGRVIWRVTGQMLCFMNNYFTDFPQEDGALPIFFARHWLRTAFGVNSSRLASHRAGVNGKITLEIDWKSGYFPRSVEVRANHEARNRRGIDESVGYRAFSKVVRDQSSVGLEQIAAREFASGAEVINAIFIVSSLFVEPRENVLDTIRIFSNGNKLYDTNHHSRSVESKILGRGGPVTRDGAGSGDSGIQIPPGMIVLEWADKNLIGESFRINQPNLSMELDWKVAPGQYELYLDQTNTAAWAGNRSAA